MEVQREGGGVCLIEIISGDLYFQGIYTHERKSKWLKHHNRTTRNKQIQQFYLPKPRTEEGEKLPIGGEIMVKIATKYWSEFKIATQKHFGHFSR